MSEPISFYPPTGIYWTGSQMSTMVDFIQWYRNRINKSSPYYRRGWSPLLDSIDATFYSLCEGLWNDGRLDGEIYIYACEDDPDFTWCIHPTSIGLAEWNNVDGIAEPEEDTDPAV